MPTRNIKTCGVCFFWDPEAFLKALIDDDPDGETADANGFGYCRLNPPAPGIPEKEWDAFAVTHKSWWCGSYDSGNNLDDLREFLSNAEAHEDLDEPEDTENTEELEGD